MRKFILVDHSLRDTGGHHHPYAASVLQAAEDAGFAPALATHHDFDSDTGLPAHWPRHALFPQISYSPHTLDTQAEHPAINGLLSRLAVPWRSFWRRRQRRRHIRQFAAACTELFRRLPLQDNDIVFFPTASELDLHGLGRYLAQSPRAAAVRWHAQLHFGIHQERDWRRTGDTAAAAAMQASLRQSLRRCGDVGLKLWCTTEPLADQYRALGVTDFEVLPYPVHPCFSAYRQLRLQPRPARVACLGHARREKNQRALPAMLASLWSDVFAPGRAQLVVQNARPTLRDALQASSQHLAAQIPIATGTQPVDCSAGKLDQTDYARLVCGSDIGLMLYDARRYHDRCSGVLLEMQVAGVPVLVPARSWLSEQIAVANQEWLADCATNLRAQDRLHRLPATDPTLELPDGCSGLMLNVELAGAAETGLGVELILAGEPGQATTRRRLWLEPPRGQRRDLCLVPIPAGSRQVAVYAATPVTVEAVTGPLPPLGAVGLAIDDAIDAADALRDILDHIDHYKRLAARHAVQRAGDCSSARIIERLVERE